MISGHNDARVVLKPSDDAVRYPFGKKLACEASLIVPQLRSELWSGDPTIFLKETSELRTTATKINTVIAMMIR